MMVADKTKHFSVLCLFFWVRFNVVVFAVLSFIITYIRFLTFDMYGNSVGRFLKNDLGKICNQCNSFWFENPFGPEQRLIGDKWYKV